MYFQQEKFLKEVRMDQYSKMKLHILEKLLFLSKTIRLFPIKFNNLFFIVGKNYYKYKKGLGTRWPLPSSETSINPVCLISLWHMNPGNMLKIESVIFLMMTEQ
jgi:hypothetical protein